MVIFRLGQKEPDITLIAYRRSINTDTDPKSTKVFVAVGSQGWFTEDASQSTASDLIPVTGLRVMALLLCFPVLFLGGL